MAIGKGVDKVNPQLPRKLVLSAPEQLSAFRTKDLHQNANKLKLIFPEINDDGSFDYWEETQPEATKEAFIL